MVCRFCVFDVQNLESYILKTLNIDRSLDCFVQKYIERAARLDGIHPDTPIYVVTEGNEPAFFTTFFSWDPSKVNVSITCFSVSSPCIHVRSFV